VERRGLAQRLVRLMANLVYRDIDVHLPAGTMPGGPVLAVANHFGGLSDGVLLIDSSPRMPRVVARDVIWKVPVVGRLASAIGMIPVHRAADGSKGSNDETFASAYRALGAGDLVLIFPEGVTQDVPHMAQVRTGAARIALGARASGVSGISVLPIGVHYENKSGFRTRALVQVGEPIDLDAWADGRPDGVRGGADDRDAVRDLTALVDERLRRVAPDFPDWATAHALHTAAEVLLTDVAPLPAAQMQYGDVELLASRLNRVAEPDRSALVEAAAQYRGALRAGGTSDRAVATANAAPARSWRWLGELLLVLALVPVALLGLMAALVPILLVTIVSRLPIAPAVRATAVPGVALLAFGGEWALFSWQSLRNGGWDLGLAAVLLFPFFVANLFLVQERVVLLWRRWGSRRRPRAGELPVLVGARAAVAGRGWAAL
jgi:1-acyl-sn-glycerol-3-phosphate acyltransferase